MNPTKETLIRLASREKCITVQEAAAMANLSEDTVRSVAALLEKQGEIIFKNDVMVRKSQFWFNAAMTVFAAVVIGIAVLVPGLIEKL